MKKRILALLLAFVMTVGLLPAAASAPEGSAHDHSSWTAVTMDTADTSKINVGGTAAESSTLTDGSYYLDGDLNVALTVTGTVSLCLNNHSVTVGSGSAVTVGSGASLTIWDCGTDSTGKIAYTGADTSYYGIYNNGTLTLNSGAVEGAYWGVCNGPNSTFTMTGGSVTGKDASSGYGVYNYSSSSVFRLSGGSVSGGKYGIYNNNPDSQVYLSGAPSISGATADIYTAHNASNIYADDGAEQNAVPYIGNAISLRYSSASNGSTIVYHVTEATKDKFTLTGSISNNYELKFVEEDNTLLIQGKPQALTWYGDNDQQLTGDDYPASVPYYTYLESSDLPAAPAVEGKLFLGWLYKNSSSSTWSTSYWSGRSITGATFFKADYIDSFTGGGSGTADDPYQLATAADLQKLSTIVGKSIAAYNNSAVWYKLTDNIDLSAVCGEGNSWTPIGCGERNSYSFKANLDGNGKTISNLYINTSSYNQGLFYKLSGATVKNLTLTGSVTAGGDLDALAGGIEDSTVENVDVTGVTLTPYGHTLDGNRIMAYKIDGTGNTTIHIQGNYKNNWIQTTYNRAGYEVATTNNLKGAVTAEAEFINGGKYVQLSYTVTAGETAITGGKLAVHADVQIGDNDYAAVEAIQDADGEVIGLKMVDTHTGCLSRDAQFNLYFDGTGGVTPVDTYWFGKFSERDDTNSTYGYIYFAPLNDSTKSSGTYEQTDGVYTRLTGVDSGFAVSWQNIDLEPGQSRTYSFILGVGEKADPPRWSGGKAVTLTLAADAEQNNRLVKVSAKVQDAAGLTDTLYYSVDGGDGEILGEVAADGSMKAITGRLDLSGYPEGSYLFSFWVVNSKGAASASVEREITITADGIQGLDSGGEPSHDHVWAEAWSSNATHHWHECAAEGCDVTGNSQKNGYAAHTEDSGTVTKPAANTETGVKTYKCSVCERVLRTEEIPMLAYSISGTVTDKDDNAVYGAEVKLMRGSTQIGESVITDSSGSYRFTGVASGLYNVVAAKDGVTKTILVELANQSADEQNIKMPDGKKNSVVEITGAGTPAVVAGGVDQIAEAETVNAGETVTVKLTVEKKGDSAADNAEEIKQAANGQTVEFLELKLQKTVTGGTNAGSSDITDTQGKVLEIVVPYDFSGKTDVTVYRYHGGSAEALTQADSKAGGTFRLGTDSVAIYATKFSTYAIGYTPEGGGTPVTPPEPTTPPVYTDGGGSGPAAYPVSVSDSTPNGAVKLSHRNAGKGTAVTITVTPDQGYELSKVTVTDRDGKELAVTSMGNGIYTFIMPSAKVTVSAVFTRTADGYKNCPKGDTCPLWAYTDINLAAWYHDGIHYCVENGLMNGCGNGKFGPNDNLTRAQFAQLLHNREGKPVADYLLRFEDVPNGAWYTEAVRWAAAQGVISGYGNGKFGPNDPITREQLVVMLWRYVGSPAVTEKELHFTDAGKAGGYALEALCWAVENGIISGYGDGRLSPQGLATRAQVAQVLKNYLESQ